MDDDFVLHLAERVNAIEARLTGLASYREMDALRADIQREADKSESAITSGLNSLRGKLMYLHYGLVGLLFAIVGYGVELLVRTLGLHLS